MDGCQDGWRSERRHRLLEAAARVFARHRYEDASMDEIAQEAGVGKPTLYRYFDSKDALFAAVFAAALDDLERRLERVLRTEPDLPSRLRGLLAEMVPTFRQHLASLRTLGEGAALADQSKRRVFRERRARIAGFLARTVEDAVATGEGRPVDPMRLAHFAIGMIWSGTAASGSAGDGAIADEIADILLHGIARPADRTASPPHDGSPDRATSRTFRQSRHREALS